MNLRSLIPFGVLLQQEVSLPAVWVHSEPWQLKTPADWPEEVPGVEEILVSPDGLSVPAQKMLGSMAEKRFHGYTGEVPYIVPAPGSGSEFGQFTDRPSGSGELRLVSVGAVTARHQPEIAIRTVKTLRAQGIEASLTWVGEGSAKIRSQEKVRELGLGDYVNFVSSQVAGGAEEALNAADIFIGPTKEENFYLPAAQAILSGRPAVLGEGAAHLDYLDASVSRIVVEKNSKFWAEACLDLQQATAGMSSAQVAATIGDRYSTQAIGRAYDDLYQQTFAASGWAN